MDAAFDLSTDDYKRKRNISRGGFLIPHQFHSGAEILYQAFERSNDYVLIRKQTGCGRAGTGEGQILWTHGGTAGLCEKVMRGSCVTTVKDSI